MEAQPAFTILLLMIFIISSWASSLARPSFQPVKSYLAETNLDDDLELDDDDETCDGKISLYAIWQTDPWNLARVGPDDKIPVNKFGNMEVQLIKDLRIQYSRQIKEDNKQYFK